MTNNALVLKTLGKVNKWLRLHSNLVAKKLLGIGAAILNLPRLALIMAQLATPNA